MLQRLLRPLRQSATAVRRSLLTKDQLIATGSVSGAASLCAPTQGPSTAISDFKLPLGVSFSTATGNNQTRPGNISYSLEILKPKHFCELAWKQETKTNIWTPPSQTTSVRVHILSSAMPTAPNFSFLPTTISSCCASRIHTLPHISTHAANCTPTLHLLLASLATSSTLSDSSICLPHRCRSRGRSRGYSRGT